LLFSGSLQHDLSKGFTTAAFEGQFVPKSAGASSVFVAPAENNRISVYEKTSHNRSHRLVLGLI